MPIAEDDDAVRAALRATVRADELARQPRTPEQVIDAIPNLSDRTKQFLKDHPQVRDPANESTVRFHYQAALDAGIPPDSDAINQAVLDGLAYERERAIAHAHRAARMVPERSDDYEVARLNAEAERAGIEIAAARATPNALNAVRRADKIIDDVRVGMLGEKPNQPAPASPMRSGVQYSAPVHRDSPSMSTGRPMSTGTRITLSPEEVEIALNSFTGEDMTKD